VLSLFTVLQSTTLSGVTQLHGLNIREIGAVDISSTRNTSTPLSKRCDSYMYVITGPCIITIVLFTEWSILPVSVSNVIS
jgi:hypothetical protein